MRDHALAIDFVSLFFVKVARGTHVFCTLSEQIVRDDCVLKGLRHRVQKKSFSVGNIGFCRVSERFAIVELDVQRLLTMREPDFDVV